MADKLRMTAFIEAPAAEIYASWLDSVGHAAMTGAAAEVDGNIGGRFSAWDGYIEGTTTALDPGKRIVQTWRTTEFPEGAPDSNLEILFEDAAGGTNVTLVQTNIPKGQGKKYKQGWEEFYFAPMREWAVGSSPTR